MHKSHKRFMFVFYELFYPTVALLGAIFLLSLPYSSRIPKCEIVVNNIYSNGYRRTLEFTPSIDMTDQFNYNVKQVFLYLVVNYKSGSNEILWSKIIKRGDNYKINKKLKNIYDIRGEIGTEVVLQLRGNVFPFVGALRNYSYGSTKCIV